MSDLLHDLQVMHTRLAPVHVIGYPRSGRSLTCRLLRRYLKVSFGTESQFVVRYSRRLRRYGDFNDDSNLRRLIYWRLHGGSSRLLMTGCWSDNWLAPLARTWRPNLLRRAAMAPLGRRQRA